MKHLYFIFLVFAGIYQAQAQFDTPGGGIAIPRTNNPVVAPTPKPSPEPSGTVSPFTLTPPKKENKATYQIGAENNSFSMFEKNEFVSRSGEYMDRVTIKPQGESNEVYRGNQFFGEHKTNADFVQVMARDFGAEDGDRIRVRVNDEIVISEITLTNSFRGLQLNLKPGFNKIDFEALNQGTSGPNTAEFRVYDDKEKLVAGNQWNLATGFKATVILIKE